MARPININVNYSAQVQEAIKAANDFQKQFANMTDATKDQIIKTAELQRAVKQLGDTADKELGKATKATKNWSAEMARMGVFVNKTMASMAASIQSFGTTIKGAFSGISSGAGGVFGGAQGLLTGFSRSISDFVGTGGFLQGLSKAVAAGASGFVKLGTDIGTFIIKGIGTVMSTVPKLLGEITQFVGNIQGLFVGLGASFFKFGSFAAGLLVSGIANAAGAIQKAFGSVLEGITGLATSVFSGLGDTIAAALGGAIEVVGAFADRIAATLSDIAGKIADVLGKGIAAGLAVAVPVAMKGAQFRDQLSSAYGVVIGQLTETQFEDLVQKAKGVATDLGLSLSQIPTALFKQVSYGFKSIEDTIVSLTAATKLAAIGNVDLYESINAINISLAAYGDKIGNAEDVSRKLFNATRSGRLEIEDLTEHLGLVVGDAEAAGIAYEELLAVINLGNRTLNSSTVVFGLANAIKSLNKPTKQAAEDFASFFESIRHGDGTLKSFKEVIQNLQRTGLSFDPKAFSEIFPDARGARAVRAIMAQVGKDFTEYDQLLKQITDDYTTFDKAAQFSLNTVVKRFAALGAQIVSVGDDFVQKFKEPIILAFDSIKNVIADFGQSILRIDPKTIKEFTKDIVDFVKSVPDRLKGVSEGFKTIVKWIKEATIAAKDFLDVNFNLTDTIKALLAGDWSNAWDMFFGSPAITKMKSFFKAMIREVQEVWNFIEGVGKQLYMTLQNLFGGLVEHIEGMIPFGKGMLSSAGGAAGRAASGGTGAGPNASGVAKLAIQTGAGVNPIQVQGNAVSKGVAGLATGAVVGAKLGSAFGPAGTAIGAVTLGLVAGIMEYITAIKDGEKMQRKLNEEYDRTVAALQAENDLRKRRTAAQEKGGGAQDRAEQDAAAVVSLQSKLDRRIQRAYQERQPILKEIADQEAIIAKVNAQVAQAVKEGHGIYDDYYDTLNQQQVHAVNIEKTLRAQADVIGDNLAKEELKKAWHERELEVLRKTVEYRKGYNERIATLNKEIGDLIVEQRLLTARPPTEYIQRGANTNIRGQQILGGASTGTQRDVSLVGSRYEAELLKAFDDLIDAMQKNVTSTDALKEATKASNIDKSNPYLSVNARAAQRRSEKASQKAYANVINQQYGSTYGATPNAGIGEFTGGFGFGGSPQEAALRQMSFGGGYGFGGGLPGEGRGFSGGFGVTGASSNKYTQELLNRLSLGKTTSTSLDQPDVTELFPGAPSAGSRARGKTGPYVGADPKLISELKSFIVAAVDKLQLFGTGKDGREELARLTEEGLKQGKNGNEILQDIYKGIQQQLDTDKDLRDKFKEDKALEKKGAEIGEKIDKKRGQIQVLSKKEREAGQEAEASTEKPDDIATIKGRQAQQQEQVTATLSSLTIANDALIQANLDLDALNAEITFEVGVLEAAMTQTISKAAVSLRDLSDVSLGMMDTFVDIGQGFFDTSQNMLTELANTKTRTDRLEKDLADLEKKIQGK